jgi:AcrR family transcriptional regulator
MAEPVDGRRLRYQHRRGDLLEAIGEYVLDHGVASLSLRRIAEAVGVSHVTLQHHFGTKDELVAEIVEHLLERTFTPRGDYSDSGLGTLWLRWTSPAGERDIRLFIEVLGQSLFDGPRPSLAVERSIEHRLDLVAASLRRLGCPDADAELRATRLMATLRGLMMDLLVTGDRDRINSTFELVRADLRRSVQEWSTSSIPLAGA